MIKNPKINYRDPFQIVSVILMLFIFSGCQKIINVDLNESAPLIVIEGLITDRPGPYMVTISKSGSYFNQPVLPLVSGAEVTITDDLGVTDILTENSPGVYFTSFIRGTSGRTYTLKVLSENKEYTGSSTLHNHVRIDSLNLTKSLWQYHDPDDDNKDEVIVDLNCYFRDPYEKNYYRVLVFKNDSSRNENYILYDDQYANGQGIGLRATRATAGDRFRIELLSIDKPTFEYYRTLQDLLYSNPVFGSTPANPKTNLNNGALGYFGTCAISSKRIIITDSLLNTVR